MLARAISKRLNLVFRNKAAFSSGHGHDDHGHGHHDYSVAVNKESPWIKYKSNPKLMTIEGVEDVNYTLQPITDEDPYEHLKNEPLFSFNRMVYNDPWFHEDSHEPYNSLPERGYINFEDPIDNRFAYDIPMMFAVIVVVFVAGLYGLTDPEMTNPEALFYDQLLARRHVTDILTEKNKYLNSLKAREAELLGTSE